MTKKRKARIYSEIGRYASLGLEMALSVIIGLAIGAFLDKRLGTGPWMTFIFLILGFAAGFRSLIRAARRSQREAEREDSGRKK